MSLTSEQQAALVELANAYLNAKPKIMFDAGTQKITTPEGLVIRVLDLFGVKASIRDPDADEPKPTMMKTNKRAARGGTNGK